MNKRTHWNIARLCSRKIEELFPEHKMGEIKKILFCLGNIEPDLSIVQFIHPHFYEKSADYIYSEIKEMYNKDKKGLFEAYKLGKLVHYLCDFCCFAHCGGMGKITSHIAYEYKINKYLNINYDQFDQKKIKIPKYADIILYIDTNIKQYRLACPSYMIDIEKSIEISMALAFNMLSDLQFQSFKNQFFSNEDSVAVCLY